MIAAQCPRCGDHWTDHAGVEEPICRVQRDAPREETMNITKRAKCPDCGSVNVKHLGIDAGSHEDLYQCRDCGQVADKSDF